ncbi:Unknown protein [Striga hermonthica]|uniref:Uncharacterized protein n=1 Tax=Striga hermonthica TaxID=68872 RepID=A0A9N7MH56_STRHE|nr:Unknown protein [Striga hermonthica]
MGGNVSREKPNNMSNNNEVVSSGVGAGGGINSDSAEIPRESGGLSDNANPTHHEKVSNTLNDRSGNLGVGVTDVVTPNLTDDIAEVEIAEQDQLVDVDVQTYSSGSKIIQRKRRTFQKQQKGAAHMSLEPMAVDLSIGDKKGSLKRPIESVVLNDVPEGNLKLENKKLKLAQAIIAIPISHCDAQDKLVWNFTKNVQEGESALMGNSENWKCKLNNGEGADEYNLRVTVTANLSSNGKLLCAFTAMMNCEVALDNAVSRDFVGNSVEAWLVAIRWTLEMLMERTSDRLLLRLGNKNLAAISATWLFCSAIPTLLAFKRAAESLEKLMDITREELPGTMAAVRLSGMEISDLTMELSDLGQEMTQGVRSSTRAVRLAEERLRRLTNINPTVPVQDVGPMKPQVAGPVLARTARNMREGIVKGRAVLQMLFTLTHYSKILLRYMASRAKA